MYKSLICCLCSVVLLTSCGGFYGNYIRDRSADYSKEKELPKLNSILKDRPLLPVPSITHRAIKPNDVPMLQNSVMQAGQSIYQLITVPHKPPIIESTAKHQFLWLKTLDYLKQQNIPITEKNIHQGQIITKQKMSVFNPQATNKNDKIELNLQLTSVDDINHISLIAKSCQLNHCIITNDEWTHDLIRNLFFYLIEHEDNFLPDTKFEAKKQYVAVIIHDENQNPILKISENFATAWQIVLQALQKTDIKITKINQSAGIINISIDENLDNTHQKITYQLVISPENDSVYISLEKDIEMASKKLATIILEKIKDAI